MSTNERRRPRINLSAIAALIVVGVALAALTAANGSWVPAISLLVWTVGIGIALRYFSKRSDTVAMLADDVHEERNVHIHRHAAIITLNIVAAVVIIAGLVDIARGGEGDPYFWLAAVIGVTYVVSLLVINRRS